MSEKKKLIIIGIIIVAIISTIPITAIITNNNSKKIIEDMNEYIESEDLKLIYIGRDDCSYCQLFKPEIDFISYEFDVDYLYINTNKLKDKHFNQMIENLKIDTDSFGTPYLVITKGGKIIDEHAGYLSDDKLFDYLKEKGLIKKDAKLGFNYINYDEYAKLISKPKELILLAQTGCEGCIKARPILYEIADEYSLKVNYLNLSLIGEENATKFKSSLDYLSDSSVSTPVLLVVSNNKVVDAIEGSVSEDDYTDFLVDNGYIEK